MPTIQEILDRIWSDASPKTRLLSDPKPVLRELGLNIPDSITVEIHENTLTLIHAVIPVHRSGRVWLSATDPGSKIIQRAWSDAAFKSRLLANPRDAVAEMGVRLPQGMDLKVWENTAAVEHIILPRNPADSELSDADLEGVAGGGVSKATQGGTGCASAAAATVGMMASGLTSFETGTIRAGSGWASVSGFIGKF